MAFGVGIWGAVRHLPIVQMMYTSRAILVAITIPIRNNISQLEFRSEVLGTKNTLREAASPPTWRKNEGPVSLLRHDRVLCGLTMWR